MHFNPVSLRALLNALESGETTPQGAIQAAEDRIEEIEPEIGAFAHRAQRSSLEEAARTHGPLSGVPLAFKDIFETADMPTEYGSPIHAGFRPASDASLVAMARAQGAAVLGKSVTTEFAFLTPARTRNPANLAHTPGGSSSGSAAAVAAGMVAGAFGSQTAGSVIRPAAFCGVAGYKPSFRLMPTAGMKGFAWTLDTVGLFAAHVGDVALLADLVTGRDLKVGDPLDLSTLRVGLYRSRDDHRLEPAMVEGLERARRRIEAAGAIMTELDEVDELSAARDIQPDIQLYEGAISLAHERRTSPERLSPALSDALDQGAAIDPVRYDDARRTARRARRTVARLFETIDIVLAPSALGAAPASLQTTGDPVMNRLWTLTGNPVVNVPGLVDGSGMPLGLSVVARFGDDRRALSAASAIERVFARADAY